MRVLFRFIKHHKQGTFVLQDQSFALLSSVAPNDTKIEQAQIVSL